MSYIVCNDGLPRWHQWGFPLVPANAGDIRDGGSIPGSGRSPGIGKGNPLQYSCLENSMDRGAWQAAVLRVTKSRTGNLARVQNVMIDELLQTLGKAIKTDFWVTKESK